ncbi:glycosyltransferase family 39 protein [Marinobacterium rhizophilum]|uniref:glycosyltransferase family 39 protein n=1 Tax=Marinobacterium rhizophilum TaxID=420402 RepID=UPI000368D50B|nr:glycosyltransferase family 39 protein [Marinobacterium rhizophilum]
MDTSSIKVDDVHIKDNHFRALVLHPLFIPLCISLGLLIRISIAVFIPIEPMSDAAWYITRAQELTAGIGYQESGHPTAYWPVGWPAILAGGFWILKSVPLTILVLNSLSAAIVMWLVFEIGRITTGSEMVARLALLAYALYPNHIAYTGAANTETVYAALSMVAFVLLIKGRNRIPLLIVSGCAFGIATLVKPQTLAFPFGAVIALTLVYKDYSWWSAIRAGIVVYIVLLLVVLPWSFRNKEMLGEFFLVSTNGGVALLLGANDQVTGDHFDYQYTPVFKQLGIPWQDRVSRQVELNRRQKDAALEWINTNTLSWLSWMPRKVLILWTKDTDGFWSFDKSYPESIFAIRVIQIINQIYYVLVLWLSLVCIYVAGKALIARDEKLMRLGLLFCMPVFVSLLAAVFTGQIRYHYPAMPYLMISASWTLYNFVIANRKAVE